jgi:serine/threonine-protein kinase
MSMTENLPLVPDGSSAPRAERLAALARRVGPSVAAFRRSPLAMLILTLVGLLVAGMMAFQWVLSAVVHSRAEVEVPKLEGKTLDQALELLKPLHLALAKEGVDFNETLPAGAVLRQAPPPGMKVREGKIIRVTLSSGGKAVFIPSLTGKSLTQAQNELRSAGATLGAVTKAYSVKEAEGMVLAQSPDPGNLGAQGQMVDVTVSKGPPPVGVLLMPDFVGKPFSSAKEWAEDQRVKASVEEEKGPADAVPGTVLRQIPAPDTIVDEAARVRFVIVSSGDKATVPVRYDVPQGSDRVEVRLVLRDEREEKEVFRGFREGGERVEALVSPQGAARVRIYVNGVLVEEKPVR